MEQGGGSAPPNPPNERASPTAAVSTKSAGFSTVGGGPERSHRLGDDLGGGQSWLQVEYFPSYVLHHATETQNKPTKHAMVQTMVKVYAIPWSPFV